MDLFSLTHLIAAAAPDVTSAGPSAEVTQKAYQDVAGSSVFGAAFVIMLGIMLLILGYLLWLLRKNDKEHTIERLADKAEFRTERDEQGTRHAGERKAMREEFNRERNQFEARVVITNKILKDKDETIERIQEARVGLVTESVAANVETRKAVEETRRQLGQLVDILQTAVDTDDTD